MERKLTKLYYSIGEVAEIFDVAPSLLRYWQGEFPGLKPSTNKKGDRRYTQKDILYIEKIYELVKVRGYTLDGARKKLSGRREMTIETEKRAELLRKLESIRGKLKDLQDELD
jgi:DNA-binding transcriptional MerR regulator